MLSLHLIRLACNNLHNRIRTNYFSAPIPPNLLISKFSLKIQVFFVALQLLLNDNILGLLKLVCVECRSTVTSRHICLHVLVVVAT